MTWLSVVTVVKDDLDGFTRSLASLAEQDLSGVEWIVVDGSEDREVIPSALDAESDRMQAVYRWQAPTGVYSAMNMALEQCRGRYAYFLNAGDVLHSPDVLARVRETLPPEAIWAFGPVAIVERDGHTVVTPPWDYAAEKSALFARGHFPAHQGTFASVSALREGGCFDARYRIAADYAAFLRLAHLADPVELPFVVATFHEGGVSTQRWRDSFREFHRARRDILRPSGVAALWERWETGLHFARVYAHREVRPRLSWRQRTSPDTRRT